MYIKKLITPSGYIISMTMVLILSSFAQADDYSPYPGKRQAKLVTVQSASSIEVSAETWPGFTRKFSISLSGIEIPEDRSGIKSCQRALAKKALSFIKNYLNNASKLEIDNISMQTSADKNAQADLITEQGSLTKALLSRGLARSSNIDPTKPWC